MCTVRALVRAKVDFLRAAELEGVAADDRSARAHEFLDVAERFAWRARLPQVICVTGLAASGKSTLAEALAAVVGRTVLSSDRIRKSRAGLDPYERAAPNAYGDDESQAVYAELGQRAAAAVHRDGGVIVDATFRRASDADAFAAASPAAAAAAWLVCEAPPAVLLNARGAARATAPSLTPARPSSRRSSPSIAARSSLRRPPLARLDTTRTTAALLADLAGALDARLQGSTASSPPLHVSPDRVGGWYVQREGESSRCPGTTMRPTRRMRRFAPRGPRARKKSLSTTATTASGERRPGCSRPPDRNPRTPSGPTAI